MNTGSLIENKKLFIDIESVLVTGSSIKFN